MLPYVSKIEFELQPRPTNGPDGKPMLYARLVPAQTLDIDYIDKFCAQYRSTHVDDIKHLFNTFFEAAGLMLASGFRLTTPIGSFAIKLKLDGEYTDPLKVTAHSVSYAGLEFTPSKQFLQEADCAKQGRGFKKRNSQVGNAQMYDPQVMEQALLRSLKDGYTTVKRFCIFSGLKYNSAARYLDSLCQGPTPQLRKVKDAGVLHYFPVTTAEAEK